jgi:protein-S-isoprenylcysteine O-methyltransferase Ste14
MFSAPLFADNWLWLSIQAFGVFLGLWAIYVMKIGNFNVIPVPKEHGVLRIKGPYRLIRHPMYTSILLFALPELVCYFSYTRFIVFTLLQMTLLLKLNYEEKLLIQKFPEYKNYMKKSKRIIPFIF